jgi:endonuclease YncB( thermonuclease family)
VSVSFAIWQRAERLKFKARLRALRRGRAETPLRSRPFGQWRKAHFTMLAGAALFGIALGTALDLLERDQTGQVQANAITQHAPPASTGSTVVLRGASSGATVIDGDTLRIGNERIRLHGVDAPESSQSCADGWAAGRMAATRLSSLTSGRKVECQEKDRDRYGRMVAICRVSGEDLGAIMVSEGLAWAFTRYSSDYVSHQAKARAGRRGVHGHDCMPAWEWRAQQRR